MKPLTQEDKEFFRELLQGMLAELGEGSVDTVQEMKKSSGQFPDPTDRATFEFERNTTLRIRDRERKLTSKIFEAIQRLENDTYGICEECEESIGRSRLEARPVTTLCVRCKEVQEQEERSHGG